MSEAKIIVLAIELVLVLALVLSFRRSRNLLRSRLLLNAVKLSQQNNYTIYMYKNSPFEGG